MQLLDLLDKDQKVQVKIFTYFLQKGQTIKIKELNDRMDVSYPTLQKAVNALTTTLTGFDSKATLTKKNSDYLQLMLPSHFSVKDFFYTYLKQALNYQLLISILQEKEVTVTKLTWENNLSEASIFRRLKTINQILAEFDIQFKNKKLNGSELQIQHFYFQLVNKAIPKEKLNTIMTEPSINNLINVIEKQLQLHFSKKQEQMLKLRLHIMQQRLDYRQVPKSNVAEGLLRQIEKDHFYQELKNILARFLSRFALAATNYEAVHLYLFFISEGLLSQNSNWWQQSPFVKYFSSIEQEIYQAITKESGKDLTFTAFLLQIHVKITFYKGEINSSEADTLLLSDIDAQAMNQCMTLVEKRLSRKVSHSQWEMLDYSYGLIRDIYQRRQQKEVLVGVIDDGSLFAEETFRFVKQALAGMSHVTVKKAKNYSYDLLVASVNTDLQEFSYKKAYLLTGTLSSFEAERLKRVATVIVKEK
ncbi:MAG: helix-turn-helix domain-containing protein [Tetragenococcus sp.]|nr:helix-turn-helix domain-containing protein [Tetragenococcus sp.]